MAPREISKLTPKVQRTVGKTSGTKNKPTPASTIKKTMSVKKPVIERNPLKGKTLINLIIHCILM
jgi:hypothetical protein